MISFIEFIHKVAPICRELHSYRQILSHQTHLHYYQMFRYLDTAMKGYISTPNLIQVLNLSQSNAKLVMKEFSKVVGTLKLMEFKELLNLSDSEKKQDTLEKQEVLIIIKAIMEIECRYITQTAQLRRELRKLDVRTILGMFQQFDYKNLSYICTKDICRFIIDSEAEVPKHIELVIRKQFKYELISFQQFYEFFQKIDKAGGNFIQQKPPQQLQKSSKRVKFNFDTIKTPKKIHTANKKEHRSRSKKSRSGTPKKFRTMSPKRHDSTLDWDQHRTNLLLRFHPDTIQKETKKEFNRYFKLYSVYS